MPLEPRNTLRADDVDRAVGHQRISRRIMRAHRALGVRYGQGYGLHRPMDAEALAGLLAAGA